MNDLYIFENHDQALKIWKRKNLRNLDLVHVDAHIDFGFPEAEPLDAVLEQSRSVEEFKRKLECSIAFNTFEEDFSKQINIGNYIYSAMREGIVKDFYWVIPGAHKEFISSEKTLITLLRQIAKDGGIKENISYPTADTMVMEALGRKINICTLASLPFFKQEVLLDIDTDFLVIESVKNSNNTDKIGLRKPWIKTVEVVNILKNNIRCPRIVTIAYSVNGGFTPMKYRCLGDELAFLFAQERFKGRYERSIKAAQFFNNFEATNRTEFYNFAVSLNPVYRHAYNNYGPLYLALKKYSLARKEFLRIRRADPANPANLTYFGLLALEKKRFRQAKDCFLAVLASARKSLFSEQRISSLLGLAEAEYRLKNWLEAKELLKKFIKRQPLEGGARYLLGRIFENENNFIQAERCYKDAAGLGFGSIEILFRMAKILFHFKEKESIINYLRGKVKSFKKAALSGCTKKEKKQIAFIEKITNC